MIAKASGKNFYMSLIPVLNDKSRRSIPRSVQVAAQTSNIENSKITAASRTAEFLI